MALPTISEDARASWNRQLGQPEKPYPNKGVAKLGWSLGRIATDHPAEDTCDCPVKLFKRFTYRKIIPRVSVTIGNSPIFGQSCGQAP